jgi:hypothetical protein
MYIFSDPSDPLGRYIDSWTPDTGVTSYGGYVNEHFQDERINCTIKWNPKHSSAGIYAKRDIYLNEELFTGYGKPQWIYTLKFFRHLLSPCTIKGATLRYNILPTDQLAPCFTILEPTSQQPTSLPATTNPTQSTQLSSPSPTFSTQPPPPPPSLDSPAQPSPNHVSPILDPPTQIEYPYGYAEGVGVSTSQLPHAGRGLFGRRPL